MKELACFLIIPILYYVGSCVFKKNNGSFELMDRSHTLFLKGAAIAIIVLVHFSNKYSGVVPSFFAASGVSIFLICSGFGLNESWKQSGRHTFWRKKLISIYIPYLIVLIVVSIAKSSVGIKEFILGALFLKVVVTYGWYMQFLFAAYLIFYITASLADYADSVKIKYIILSAASILCLCLPNQIYAEQALSFTLGVAISDFKLHKKAYNKYKFIFIGMCFVLLMLVVKFFVKEPYILDTFLWMAIKTGIAVLIIYITYIFQNIINIYAFQSIGIISYAMYLIHGYFWFIIDFNKGIACISAYILTMTVLAAAFTHLTNKISNLLLGGKNGKIKVNDNNRNSA